jgi:hypothetical protein
MAGAMPRATGPSKPRKGARPPAKKAAAKPAAQPPTVKLAVAESPMARPPAAKPRVEEPVWLVRIVLLLFLVGFAAFLAREVYSFVQALG